MAQRELRRSARKVLIKYLKELDKSNLKKFHGFLLDYPIKEGFRKIPKGRLEKANPLITAEVMIAYYQEAYALEITGHLLDKTNRKDLTVQFSRDTEKYHRKKYMAFIADKFRVMEEKVSRSGEYIHLDERYTKLLILKNHRDQEERKHEIMITGRKHLEIFIKRAASSYTCIADLFEPDDRGHLPRTVVLQGAAGIGKTMTARKIMFDWASGELFQGKFNYVFYINCRIVNQFDVDPTLDELVLETYPEMSLPMSDLEHEQEKLLFIVDGFNELKLPENVPLKHRAKVAKMDNTLQSLIGKKCFLKSYILITTRPTALERLSFRVETLRFAEILGFSEEDRKEYFIKFFKDKTQGTNAFKVVEENETLFTMCFIPIVCWISCTVLKEQLKKNGDFVDTLKSTTSLYLSFLYNLLTVQSSDAAQSTVNTHLKKLCALANEGIFKQKILFKNSDLIKHGLTFPEIQSLFLKNYIFIADAQFHQQLYSFIHLRFQEFLAALFYILRDDEDGAGPAQDPQQDMLRLLKAYRKERQNHLMLTVRFLFGLLNAQILRQMKKRYKWKISADLKPALQQWIKEEIGDSISERHKDLLYCLYEIQNEEFAKKAVQSVSSVDITNFTARSRSPLDGRVLTFCMKNSTAIKLIDLSYYTLKPVDVRMLLPCLAKCSSIMLWGCSLTGSCCTDRSSLLETNTSLTELNLSNNKLEDSGVRQLCEGLKRSSCTLQNLGLWGCSLTASCCTDLSSFLETNTSLTELNLGYNVLEDSGVRQLCEGLKRSNCKLQKLMLVSCSLTASCCTDLSSFLETNTTLTELKLGDNKLEDSGARQLCEALKQPSCKLENLGLSRMGLTDESTESLCLALITKRSLQYLGLHGNHFTGRSAASFHTLKKTVPNLKEDNLSSPMPLTTETYMRNENAYNYRATFSISGTYICANTGLCFEVNRARPIEYSLRPWNHHLTDGGNPEWMAAGPLFEIKADPGLVGALYLPHFVFLKDGGMDISQIIIAHFEANGNMTLESPSLVQPFHVVLRDPKFSILGAIFNKYLWNLLPVRACALLYQLKNPADVNTTIHLHVIPDDPLLIKELDNSTDRGYKKIKKSAFIPTALYYGKTYTVESEPGSKIKPKENYFCGHKALKKDFEHPKRVS